MYGLASLTVQDMAIIFQIIKIPVKACVAKRNKMMFITVQVEIVKYHRRSHNTSENYQ